MTAAENARAVQRYFDEVLNEARLGVLEEIARDDMVDQLGMSRGWPPGRAGLVHHVSTYLEAYPGAQATVERLVASDDQVAVLWKARRSADDDTEIGTVASYFTMSDGRIAEYLVGAMSGFAPATVTDQ